MRKERNSIRKGLTLIELMASTVIAVIVIAGIGLVLFDSHRGYNSMYNRVYSDVVTNGHVARRYFDSIARRAVSHMCLVDSDGLWIKLCYYSDPNVVVADRYSRFFNNGDSLYVEHGQLNPEGALSVESVAEDVTSCRFAKSGRAVQMLLTLNDGREQITTVTSAVMHN